MDLDLKFLLLFGVFVLLIKYSVANLSSNDNTDSLTTILHQQKDTDVDSLKLAIENEILILKKRLDETKVSMDSLNSMRIDTLMQEVSKLDRQIELIEQKKINKITGFFELILLGSSSDKAHDLKMRRSVYLNVIDTRHMILDIQKQELDSIFKEDSIKLREFEKRALQDLDYKYDSLVQNVNSL